MPDVSASSVDSSIERADAGLGASVGAEELSELPLEDEGDAVGAIPGDGARVTGAPVVAVVGICVGTAVGDNVGSGLGKALGAAEGTGVGFEVVGTLLGAAVGTDVGSVLGICVGTAVGYCVGHALQDPYKYSPPTHGIVASASLTSLNDL